MWYVSKTGKETMMLILTWALGRMGELLLFELRLKSRWVLE